MGGMRTGALVMLASAAAACGRAGFDAEVAPEEACDWQERLEFQAPRAVANIDMDGPIRAPFITAEGEALYFASGTEAASDFYIAEADEDGAFTEPSLFDALSGDGDDTALSFAADHLEVIFASDRGAGSTLFLGARPALAAPFVDQGELGGVSTGGDDGFPHLAESDLALYFAGEGPEGTQDLFVARRPALDEGFGEPARLAELSSDADDIGPAVFDDGRVIVFSSTRSGESDLYFATRSSVDEPFGAPEALGPLNSAARDTDPFVTRDGCFVYFASDRGGGELSLFVARAFR